ncbi:HK97 gp10 family phage protein [Pseudomonas sp. LS.1a]|uniref:HK97 gp10 family phage protein n=1 Tax=Pseudomonas sp. LS.1a TaxID=2920387 RepID=UPI001F14299C|nr:HK97 gp10 family phage protein [Pseudomonas sp. LS.1a]UMY59805.1 HK97 gp10 family phage protein [Pseudomonas sp. LS.1a]
MAKSRGWSTPPSLFTGLVEEALTQRVRVIALAMLNEIVLRSPVDTGRFRGNNIVSVGAPVYASSVNVDPTGSETIQQGVRVMTGLEPFTQVFIQNNLPYAVPLEDGHSQQAPAGIYAVSFNSVSQAYS